MLSLRCSMAKVTIHSPAQMPSVGEVSLTILCLFLSLLIAPYSPWSLCLTLLDLPPQSIHICLKLFFSSFPHDTTGSSLLGHQHNTGTLCPFTRYLLNNPLPLVFSFASSPLSVHVLLWLRIWNQPTPERHFQAFRRLCLPNTERNPSLQT